MGKILSIAILTLLASLCLQAKETIKIGVVLPLSGNSGYLGQNSREGIEVRLKELSKDSNFDYQVIYEDDELVPAKINLANRKLLSFDKVDVIVSLWGFGYDIAMPVIKSSKRDVVHMNLDSWANPDGYPYDFVLCASCEQYAEKMAESLQAMGTKTVAFLGTADADERRYCAFLKKHLQGTGIKMLDESYTNYEVRDFRTYALKIRELHPDVFVSSTQQPMLEIAIRQMKDLGYRPVLAAASAGFLDVTDKSLVENSYYVLTPPSPNWFVEKFKGVYKRTPNYPAANGYDLMSVLIAACEKLPANKKPTAAEISAELRTTKDYNGALGPTSYASPNKLPSPVVCYHIVGGKGIPVSMEELKTTTERIKRP